MNRVEWRHAMTFKRDFVFGILLLMGVSVLISGCPKISVKEVAVKPDSFEDGAFTFQIQVEVTYEREICEPDDEGNQPGSDCEIGPETLTSLGVIGVWLPEGWSTQKARLQGGNLEQSIILDAAPELAPGFVDTFPHAPGRWWPYVTPCVTVSEG